MASITLYNGYQYPELPAWTNGYAWVEIRAINVTPHIFATNAVKYETKYVNSYVYYIQASCEATVAYLENGEWGAPTSDKNGVLWADTYPHTANTGVWDSADVYGVRDVNDIEGTKYLVHAGSAPVRVEWGWTDYGSNDDLSITQITTPHGDHFAGAWRCSVSGDEVASFKWYKNGVLIREKTGGTHSDCRPTDGESASYYCVVTFKNNATVTTDTMTVTIGGSGSGGGGSGGDSGGGDSGGGDGDITGSLVTDIVLTVSPDSVVPGGHSLIEVCVNGIGNYSQAFTAEMKGNFSANTFFVKGGYTCNVWIAEDETADYVLVTVASVQDPTITATEMIFIDQSATEEEGTTAEQLQNAYWKGFSTCRAYFQQTKLSEGATIRITKDGDEPSTEAGQLKRAFWKGFVACLGTFEIVPAEYVAYLENGVLYIKKAPAVQNGNTLEFESGIIALLTDGVLYVKKAPATLNGNTLEVK